MKVAHYQGLFARRLQGTGSSRLESRESVCTAHYVSKRGHAHLQQSGCSVAFRKSLKPFPKDLEPLEEMTTCDVMLHFHFGL